MRKFNLISLLFIFVLLYTTNISAQNGLSEETIKSTIDEIFQLASEKNYRGITPFIVYTGENLEKKYKVSLNPENSADLRRAERLAKKIKAYIDISDQYEVTEYIESAKDNNNWVNVTVAFKSGSQILDIEFVFLRQNGKILLAEID